MAERAVAEAHLRTLLVHKPIRIGEFLHLVSWRLDNAPAIASPPPLAAAATKADGGQRSLD